jgi:hypothetical protein
MILTELLYSDLKIQINSRVFVIFFNLKNFDLILIIFYISVSHI